MNSQWDRHWNIICLGTITITSAVVGTAFFSANLADLATPANTEIEFWWLGYRLLVSVLIGLVYLTMIRRSQEAIFATNFELLRSRH